MSFIAKRAVKPYKTRALKELERFIWLETRGTEPAPKGWSAQPVCVGGEGERLAQLFTVTNP